MKKALVLTTVLVAGSFYLSCEKDDICAEDTPTTPSVVVEFYNKDNATVLRTVDDLAVIAVNETDTLPLNDSGTLISSVSRVLLPLRTDQDVTEYRLIYRSRATDGTRNEDLLRFNYTRTETYVSRACGYKTTFTLTPPTPVTDMLTPGADGTRWTAPNGISIENTSIENETEAHVKIYF
jgi:hypothetical protein